MQYYRGFAGFSIVIAIKRRCSQLDKRRYFDI